MLKKKLELRIDIHRLVGTTTLLNQMDVCDDEVDDNIHQFMYCSVLTNLSEIYMTLRRSALIGISLCERGR